MKKKTNKTAPEPGNRTGVMIAPDLAKELVEGVNRFSPEPSLDGAAAAAIREQQIEEGIEIGSRPTADDPAMASLYDKLGARLAFERSGVRLYDALIQKRAAIGGKAQPTVDDLQEIREEELEHLHMLEECIVDLGGDPTMVTPSADIGATMSSGVLKVLTDPRTTIPQCLEAILAAELIDNDCWAVLITLMQSHGLDEEANDFNEALGLEQEHLKKVRKWITAVTTKAA